MASSRVEKITVITVCLNSESTIRRTLDSLAGQSFSEIEHIVVDGLSTDDTLSIVEEYRERVAVLVSEKDEGIYDAMNKGLKLASGDIVFFLNSDDYLADSNVFSDVVSLFNKKPDTDLVFGDVYYKYGVDKVFRNFRSVSRRNLIYRDLCHQAVFARRPLFSQVGFFDTQYTIGADFDWLLKAFRLPCRYCHIDRVITYFNAKGAHSSDIAAARAERKRIKMKYSTPYRYTIGEFFFRVRRTLFRLFSVNC